MAWIYLSDALRQTSVVVFPGECGSKDLRGEAVNRRPTCSHREFTAAYTCLQKIGNAEHKSKSRNLRDNRGEMKLPMPHKTLYLAPTSVSVTTLLRLGIQLLVFDKKGPGMESASILKVATKLGSFQHSWTGAKMAEFLF